MKKWWRKGIIVCVLMGSAIGVNAQNITYFGEDDYGYEVAEEPIQNSISEVDALVAKEGAFKLNITIPYSGENGHIDRICLSRYDVEGKRGERYEGRVDLSTEIPVDNYYVQIIARDDDNYYCLYAKTNNGMITFTESDLVSTQVRKDSTLNIRSVLVVPRKDILLQSLNMATFKDMEDKKSITVVSNKDLESDISLMITDNETGVICGLENEVSMTSNQSITFGHTYKSSFNSINRKYSTNQNGFLSLTN